MNLTRCNLKKETLAALTQCTQLEVLHLAEGMNLTSKDLEQILINNGETLREFHLNHLLTTEILETFKKHGKSLRLLDLWGAGFSHLSKEAQEEFKIALPDVEILTEHRKGCN